MSIITNIEIMSERPASSITFSIHSSLTQYVGKSFPKIVFCRSSYRIPIKYDKAIKKTNEVDALHQL